MHTILFFINRYKVPTLYNILPINLTKISKPNTYIILFNIMTYRYYIFINIFDQLRLIRN